MSLARAASKKRARVRGVGLVALHIGTHVLRREQPYLDPPGPQRACPVVRRAAGLHHHQGHRPVVDPARKLRLREPRFLHHPPALIGNGDFEHVLGQIHGNGSSIHLGLLLSD
jgi:hypothetical protein